MAAPTTQDDAVNNTRLVTFLWCPDNNRSDTVTDLFHWVTEEFGTPELVRTDYGGENVGVWMAMYGAYEEEQFPVCTGKSVHNQRVERNNRDLNVAITLLFKRVFQELQLERNLNVDNEKDMFCLHYVYLPRINRV